MLKSAQFRFYEELNDFLPKEKRKRTFFTEFSGNPSIKDIIEALGVPHTEIDLVLVNNQSVNFSYHLKNGDYVSVYPEFESMDIKNVTKLRCKPLRHTKFILDINLGKLSRYLRMLGFDTQFSTQYTNSDLINIAQKEKRIVLTKNIGLLKNKEITHGFWVRAQNPKNQIKEIINRLHLESNINPFSLCLVCNGELKSVKKESVINNIPEKIKNYKDQFWRCSKCNKIYWHGSHYQNMNIFISNILK